MENKKEKIEKLKEVNKTLKREFIGIDDIIDKICESITPWYVTPEILERPVIVSLWGMTGTGKTSVVRRLIELLDYKSKSIFLDCGQESNSSSSLDISDKLSDFFMIDKYSDDSDVSNQSSDSIIIFDEFQYARTIDNGNELAKPQLRPIWSLIDCGKLSIVLYSYNSKKLIELIEDIESFIHENEKNKFIEVKKGVIENRDDVKEFLSCPLISYNYGREIDDESSPKDLSSASSNNDNSEEDPYSPLSILNRSHIRTILKLFGPDSDRKIVNKLLNDTITLQEFLENLNKIKSILTRVKEIDCSKSLIFIIGNLDEAFEGITSELSPDMDADIFREETINITISDLKEALKKRFRAEQIARFGNNIIKYPTLGKSHFIEIINKELLRISNKFELSNNISIKFDDNITNLIYSEGVYPTQGVRPVLTTIGLIITPLLSDIILNKEDNDTSVNLKLIEENLKSEEVSIRILFNNSGKEIIKKIRLVLGSLRDPRRLSTRFITSVHEIGHGIVYMYRSGEYPNNIFGISTNNGGFCNIYNKRTGIEINSKYDIDTDVMVSLAGYEAEQLIFGHKDKDMCLLGSSSDIENSWSRFCYAAYNCGYFIPYSFSNYMSQVKNFNPAGLNDESRLISDKSLQQSIYDRFEELRKDTVRILTIEKNLLKNAAIELGEKGSLSMTEFKELVSKFGNIEEEDLIKTRSKLTGKWYEDVLRSFN